MARGRVCDVIWPTYGFFRFRTVWRTNTLCLACTIDETILVWTTLRGQTRVRRWQGSKTPSVRRRKGLARLWRLRDICLLIYLPHTIFERWHILENETQTNKYKKICKLKVVSILLCRKREMLQNVYLCVLTLCSKCLRFNYTFILNIYLYTYKLYVYPITDRRIKANM